MSSGARPRQTNERLRGVVAAARLTTHSLAALVDVDPKSVDRWITEGRLPQRRTRVRAAEVLGHDETYLWPELRDQGGRSVELVQMWPERAVVPSEVWELITNATPLYVSIFRGDNTLLVNAHTHGLPGMSNPLMHFEQVPGQPFVPYYDAAFERVWELARPIKGA